MTDEVTLKRAMGRRIFVVMCEDTDLFDNYAGDSLVCAYGTRDAAQFKADCETDAHHTRYYVEEISLYE